MLLLFRSNSSAQICKDWLNAWGYKIDTFSRFSHGLSGCANLILLPIGIVPHYKIKLCIESTHPFPGSTLQIPFIANWKSEQQNPKSMGKLKRYVMKMGFNFKNDWSRWCKRRRFTWCILLQSSTDCKMLINRLKMLYLFDWCSTFFGKSHSPTLTDIDVSTNER